TDREAIHYAERRRDLRVEERFDVVACLGGGAAGRTGTGEPGARGHGLAVRTDPRPTLGQEHDVRSPEPPRALRDERGRVVVGGDRIVGARYPRAAPPDLFGAVRWGFEGARGKCGAAHTERHDRHERKAKSHPDLFSGQSVLARRPTLL